MSESKKTESKPKKVANKPSSVDSPVAVVRELCEAMKGKPRKDVIAEAVKRGVNRSTAATQYQLFRGGKVPKAKK